LYTKGVLELEKELFLRTKKREFIIKQKVKVEVLADISLLKDRLSHLYHLKY